MFQMANSVSLIEFVLFTCSFEMPRSVKDFRNVYEKRKVMSAAKNPIESSLGKTLLKTNFKDDRWVFSGPGSFRRFVQNFYNRLRLIAWTSGPCCNIQLKTSFFKPKDSFTYTVQDCEPQLPFYESFFHLWISSIGNTFAYELHLFGWISASQRVTQIERNIFPVVHAISLRSVRQNVIIRTQVLLT